MYCYFSFVFLESLKNPKEEKRHKIKLFNHLLTSIQDTNFLVALLASALALHFQKYCITGTIHYISIFFALGYSARCNSKTKHGILQ